MVIGREIPRSLNAIFQAANSIITRVPSGKVAVARAQREMFDAAILLSTGKEMDLTETVLNLNDIRGSMELIILSDYTDTIQSAVPQETLVNVVSSVTVMTTRELAKHLNWF